MSSSVRLAANGDICSSLRRPSRNLMSCQWVKNVGCPASEGVPGIVALPSGPWHLPHGSDLRRPASTSAASAALPAASVATSSAVVKTKRISLLRVADAIDRARVVVRDEHRAVLHLRRVDRPAPDLLALQPALHEGLVLADLAVARERHHHHAVADLLAPVPGAALGQENTVLVLGREPRARVEHHAVAGHVGAGLEDRRHVVLARLALAELGVERVALMAER